MTVAQITPPAPRTDASPATRTACPSSASSRARSPTPPATAPGDDLAAPGVAPDVRDARSHRRARE